MTPDQKAIYEALTGLVHRTAMKIAELPEDARGAALQIASKSIAKRIGDESMAEGQLIEICTDGIVAVLRQIEASDRPSGGHA